MRRARPHKELCEKSDLNIVDPSSSSKALGLHWHVETDQLYVPVPELPTDVKVTKRFIASATAKIFDVLGFFAPSVLQAKLIYRSCGLCALSGTSKFQKTLNLNGSTELHNFISLLPTQFIAHLHNTMVQCSNNFMDSLTHLLQPMEELSICALPLKTLG